jgi:hypothetical protein
MVAIAGASMPPQLIKPRGKKTLTVPPKIG